MYQINSILSSVTNNLEKLSSTPSSELKRQRFGIRLRRVMERLHMTPLGLAKRVGVDRTTAYNWSAGRRLPQPEYHARLCVALKIRHGDLFYG